VQGAAARPRGLRAPGFLNGVDEAREVALAARVLTGCSLEVSDTGGGVMGQRRGLHDCGTLSGPNFSCSRSIVLHGLINRPVAAGRVTSQAKRIIAVGHFVDLASGRYYRQFNSASSAEPM